MKAEQVLHILECSVAPVKLSDEFCVKYNMYDNSGIIINCGNEVTGALFSLDFSIEAVNRAICVGTKRFSMVRSPVDRYRPAAMGSDIEKSRPDTP